MFSHKIILITCLVQAFVLNTHSCGIVDFVKARLTEFPAWVRRNNLDPSPLRDGPDEVPVSTSISSFQLEIRNHGISGYSNAIDVGYVYSDVPSRFEVQFGVIGNISFFGQYRAFGTINNRPVSLDGSWYIKTSSIYTSMFSVSFQELPTGYLNVTGYSLYSISFGLGGYEIYFENLSDNEAAAGYEEEINTGLFYGFNTYLVSRDGYTSNHPFRRSYIQYWQDVLSQTKLEDIYGSSPPLPVSGL